MKPTVSVIGKYVYPEALETLLFRGFQDLDVDVVPRPYGEADLSLCVKMPYPPEGCGGVTALLMTDNRERFPEAVEWVDNFDEVFAIHGDLPGSHRINPGYDPGFHHPFKGKVEGHGDPVFIGTGHGCRDWLGEVDGLRIFGNDWGRHGVDTEPIYRRVKRREYARARFSVNQTYPGDVCNMRFYEALSISKSTPLVTDEFPPGEGWVPGEHFFTYDGTLEGLRSALDGLGEEDLGEVAEAGHGKVEEFTYARRAEEILETLDLNR